ncbi:MAG: hypothetical protein ACFFAO_18065, partial [Candidatus Hermodarchaeota archaeon]
GINQINIIVDELVDISEISDSFNKVVNKLKINSPELKFIKNLYPERENGYSLYLGINEIKSKSFILSMADHIFSDNIYSLLIKNYKNEDIVLATDPMKIKGIYDLDDCTKVFGNNSSIINIGKKIADYNRLDMGAFIMKTDTIYEISQEIERNKQKFGVSDVLIKAIESNLKVSYFDLQNTIWLDIDTDIEYKKINKIFYKSSKLKPFDLDIF